MHRVFLGSGGVAIDLFATGPTLARVDLPKRAAIIDHARQSPHRELPQ